MNQQRNGLGLQVALGIFGFFVAAGLSLATGNLLVTSLIRGAIALFVFFFIGYVLKFAITTFVGAPPQNEEMRGRHIDLLLPEQPQEEVPPSERTDSAEDGSDFVPLVHTVPQQQSNHKNKADAFQHVDPQKIADAMRHLDE